MTKLLLGAMLALSMVLGAGPLACADSVTARIPFQFKAGKQVLPAGTYVITFDKASPKAITLRAQGGTATARVPIVTALAVQDLSGAEAHLVFDKVENEHTIAEFWPARADGYFLGGAIVSHTHVVVDAQ